MSGTVTFNDHNAVMEAYASVPVRYFRFLLKYAQESDDLMLHAQGDQGLAELKKSLDEPTYVHFGLYREDATPSGYVLINYIPSLVSGVRKARALVHSRRLASSLIKTEYATLTVDHISNLTPTSLHQAIKDPEGTHSIQLHRMSVDLGSSHPSNSVIPSSTSSPHTHAGPMRRSASDMLNSSSVPSKLTNMISSLKRKANRSESATDDLPPPTPPKDKDTARALHQPSKSLPSSSLSYTHNDTHNDRDQQHTLPMIPEKERERRISLSEFAVISHSSFDEEPELVEHPHPVPSPPKGSLFLVPLDKKWIPETTYIPDPTERAQRRILAQRQKEKEEEELMREEAERQKKLKLKKQEMMRQEEEEARRRKASLELEIKQLTAERRLKEKLAQEEEERERRERERRKQAERKRRMEEHEKLEKWRNELAKRALETEKKEMEERKSELTKRRQRILDMAKQIKADMKAGRLVVEWATIQTDELVWKRRYVKLIGTTLYMHRSPKDMTQVLDEIELKGAISALCEPSEGFEELEAIPHSFAVKFKDGRESWSMFGDTEEQKDRLLGILHYAAGL
ncbi:hypothetical protein D9758_006002 [Tetrapyrgos nigripes]|uniref:ADF-H domain-containing protein n=1 Tax=Tetrapyrgos nigripes TaxID=182062 RepID=A0A8H5D7U7_9AGAR|nr:hypothetical protein D9758_006002 [Tetrapyrgos nigripes]